jgi:acyl dehydratase
MSAQAALEWFQARVGTEVHVSDWMEITQERVDTFAKATDDFQWIHTQPERAAKESPWRTTIAHGYLTMSLYPALRGIVEEGRPLVPGLRTVVNYGTNKMRFVNAVKVGARVRGRIRLLEVEEVKGCVQIVEEYTVEIDGESKPACVAEVIMRLYF